MCTNWRQVTVEEGVGGCAIRLQLTGADGVEWLGWTSTETTSTRRRESQVKSQGSQYKVFTDVYFGDGLTFATPEPATDCTWTYDFTRI